MNFHRSFGNFIFFCEMYAYVINSELNRSVGVRGRSRLTRTASSESFDPERGQTDPKQTILIQLLVSRPTLNNITPTMPKTQINFPKLPVRQPSGSEILARERAKATFDSDELARYIHGDEYLERQERLLKILENDPLFNKSDVYYQGRDEKFRASMAKAKRMIQVAIFYPEFLSA